MYRSCAVLAAMCLAACVTSLAQAITIRDDKPDSLYTALASRGAYAGVGKVFNSLGDDSGRMGSGTLIGSQWVLTAAHMVAGTQASSNLTFELNNTSYSVDRYSYYRGYTGGTSPGDLALIHLSAPISGMSYASLFTGSAKSLIGLTATYVGYGTTGTGLTGNINPYGIKRAAQNVIDGTSNQVSADWPATTLISDFDQPGNPEASQIGSVDPLPLEGLPAHGDSGGGMFVDINGHTYLAGVISFVAHNDGSDNSNYGDFSGAISVSDFSNWIDSTTGIGIVPEPSTLTTLALSVTALLMKHKGMRD